MTDTETDIKLPILELGRQPTKPETPKPAPRIYEKAEFIGDAVHYFFRCCKFHDWDIDFADRWVRVYGIYDGEKKKEVLRVLLYDMNECRRLRCPDDYRAENIGVKAFTVEFENRIQDRGRRKEFEIKMDFFDNNNFENSKAYYFLNSKLNEYVVDLANEHFGNLRSKQKREREERRKKSGWFCSGGD